MLRGMKGIVEVEDNDLGEEIFASFIQHHAY
jgi:hypothetical protein